MRAHAARLSSSPYFLLCAASLLWAINMVVGRAMRNDIPPVAMAFWRWTIAFAIVLPFTWQAVRSRWSDIVASWKVLALIGFVGICCFNTMCYIGLTMTTATNGTLFNSIVPVFIPPIAWVLLRERARSAQIAGTIVSLAGVLVIVANGSLETLLALSFNRGDVWLLLAMVLWSLYTVLLRFRPQGLAMLPFLSTVLLFGWPMLAVWYGIDVAAGSRFPVTLPNVATLLYYGIFPSIVAFVCYNRGVSEVGPTRAGIFVHLVPVFGIVLSTIALGEPPHGFHYVGMVLIFAGIALATRPIRPAPP